MAKTVGTAEELIKDGLANGVTRYVVHSVVTTAHQVRSINEFIKYEIDLHPEFITLSTSLPFISSEKAKEIISELGVDKLFFATDFPMWDTKTELERFNKISLSSQEKRMIFSENIKNLLKLN